jgi:hypothetical protein
MCLRLAIRGPQFVGCHSLGTIIFYIYVYVITYVAVILFSCSVRFVKQMNHMSLSKDFFPRAYLSNI